MEDIPFAFTGNMSLPVTSCEFIPDAYKALIFAAESGKIELTSYRQNSEKMLKWIETVVREEYEKYQGNPEYRFFLKTKFNSIL